MEMFKAIVLTVAIIVFFYIFFVITEGMAW